MLNKVGSKRHNEMVYISQLLIFNNFHKEILVAAFSLSSFSPKSLFLYISRGFGD